jgi:hypothetical protein
MGQLDPRDVVDDVRHWVDNRLHAASANGTADAGLSRADVRVHPLLAAERARDRPISYPSPGLTIVQAPGTLVQAPANRAA